MDIISAMDRSAMDRFSWNYADTIVESSWKILATFEREKSLFIQEDSRIARAKLSLKLCGAPTGLPIEKENKIERTSPASWAGKNMSKFWCNQIEVSYLNFMRNFLLTLKYVLVC